VSCGLFNDSSCCLFYAARVSFALVIAFLCLIIGCGDVILLFAILSIKAVHIQK